MKSFAIAGILTAAICATTIAIAQEPPQNVDPKRHANLAAAQSLVVQAWGKIGAAQKVNDADMAGHAQKAKDLLVEVNMELKLAAEAASKH